MLLTTRIPLSASHIPVDPRAREREWSDNDETETASLLEALTEPGAGASAQTFLVLRYGDRIDLVDLPSEGEWIVGRGAQVQLVIDDRRASRRHAKLCFSAGALSIEDLGSHNGTIVNGRRLRKRSVRIGVGDVVKVADCELVVAARSGRDDEAPPSGEPSNDAGGIVLADPEMARVYGSVRKVSRMPTTVLIMGETGAGKDVIARRLHEESPRRGGPFVRVNCGAIPEALLESELFGYERGAFTGADRRKLGYFETASGGTLFLDEIGELSPAAQIKLLHVLENKSFARIGATTLIPMDARVVCATHRDLQALIADGRFRADLYFRVASFVLRVPPLRHRVAEIPVLANVFVRELAKSVGGAPPRVTAEALSALTAYPWPGNVRELRNAIEHAFVMAEGSALRLEHFSSDIRTAPGGSGTRAAVGGASRSQRADRDAIEKALAAEGGNQTRAALRLGMPRRTLVYKLAQYRSAADSGDGSD